MSLTAVNRRSIMTLYSRNKDAYSHRVRIVLAEKGVTYDIIDVDTSAKAQEAVIELNPYGFTPILLDRDLVLYHSEVIMEYLDERSPHPPLMPIYPVAKGRSRLMLYRINRDWYSLMNTILDETTVESEKKSARRELRDSLTGVTPVFSELPFFMSEEFSLVDCCLIPLLWRLPILGIDLPRQAKPVMEYAKRMFDRESVQAALTDAEIAMHKST